MIVVIRYKKSGRSTSKYVRNARVKAFRTSRRLKIKPFKIGFAARAFLQILKKFEAKNFKNIGTLVKFIIDEVHRKSDEIPSNLGLKSVGAAL